MRPMQEVFSLLARLIEYEGGPRYNLWRLAALLHEANGARMRVRRRCSYCKEVEEDASMPFVPSKHMSCLGCHIGMVIPRLEKEVS